MKEQSASYSRNRKGPPKIPGHPSAVESLLEKVDLLRLDATRRLDESLRAEMGQFLTPSLVARFMASLFDFQGRSIRLLDAGAGVGSLSAAFVTEVCRAKKRPESLTVTAYEVDPTLLEYLKDTLNACRAECERAGIAFNGEIRKEDFIRAGVLKLREDLFTQHTQDSFNYAILNPPYRKIHSGSDERLMLRSVGVEAGNLYTAFLSIVVMLLAPSGQLVAITPRSFCNGPYFTPFRKMFLGLMALRRIHIFESRNLAFQEDEVLQENVIFHAAKGAKRQGDVVISSNMGPEDEHTNIRTQSYDALVQPGDPNSFIRILTDELDNRIAERVQTLQGTLDDLGISVSTGRVVDFRAREFLRDNPEDGTVPLVHPGHFEDGFVKWPKPEIKKPQAIIIDAKTEDLLIPGKIYVLVKRFSAKEERRRIVAAVYDPDRLPADKVGFENHLNYYYRRDRGLSMNLAKGLTAYLNTALVDSYFRQFSGHTQVNALDLRSLKYPTEDQLEALGLRIGVALPEQDELDRLLEKAVMRRK